MKTTQAKVLAFSAESDRTVQSVDWNTTVACLSPLARYWNAQRAEAAQRGDTYQVVLAECMLARIGDILQMLHDAEKVATLKGGCYEV